MWRGIFSLCYTQHGGSGLNLGGIPAVMDLDFDRFLWLLEHLMETREHEAKQMRSASKG